MYRSGDKDEYDIIYDYDGLDIENIYSSHELQRLS